MGKLPIFIVMFDSYVKLPEVLWLQTHENHVGLLRYRFFDMLFFFGGGESCSPQTCSVYLKSSGVFLSKGNQPSHLPVNYDERNNHHKKSPR